MVAALYRAGATTDEAGLRWARRWSSSCCAGQLIDRLLAEVDEFSENVAQHDDQTIIVLEVK